MNLLWLNAKHANQIFQGTTQKSKEHNKTQIGNTTTPE